VCVNKYVGEDGSSLQGLRLSIQLQGKKYLPKALGVGQWIALEPQIYLSCAGVPRRLCVGKSARSLRGSISGDVTSLIEVDHASLYHITST